ncbi:hypothetical protein ACIG5E_37110 [Kitasatospora sp. NPDC053057]|uniref:hypothetical protein n=1 Tax=Kitasatospora sp. NPDC053057 TaxID=3364062 RepID=UPI0037C7821A
MKISDEVVAAIDALQTQAMRTSDVYQLDRIERAIDELLRNPGDDKTPARHRVRSALAHAYELLQRRKEIAPQGELCPERESVGYTEQGYHQVELLELIRVEPSFKHADRVILGYLVRGADAVTLAEKYSVPVPRMRERISRLRCNARKAWPDLALAA